MIAGTPCSSVPPRGAGAAGARLAPAKCAYGLVDSPLLWYKRVFEVIRELGAERSAADHGLLILVEGGVVTLAVAVHVDDFLYGGTAAGLELFETKLRAAFSAGPVAVGNLVFTGLAISFAAASGARPASIWVNQKSYVDCLDDIPTPPARLANKGAAGTVDELAIYRRSTGALL